MPMVIGKATDKPAPCQQGCPAGINVPRYIRLVRQGKYADALAVIRERIPFPSICGHVCLSPCEAACRNHHATQSVAINAIKRFVTEQTPDFPLPPVAPSSSKRVAVIGSGPAGLSAAYYLTLLGHEVVVFETLSKPGGMMRVGIPSYRIPEDVLDREIEGVRRIGFEIRTKAKVASAGQLTHEGYDAVLIAIGAHVGVGASLTGSNLEGVLTGMEFLGNVKLGKKFPVGKNVVVLGGGNVAFDCGRVALRLGCKECHLVCLECGDNLPATPEEIREGVEEGIILNPSHNVLRIVGDKGRVIGVECCEIKSFCFGENGDLQIGYAGAATRTIPADTFIFAVGQRPELNLVEGNQEVKITKSKKIVVDPMTLATEKNGVFATGDVVTGTVSVIAAIAAGRKAAVSIDRFLGGDGKIIEVTGQTETTSNDYPRGRPVGRRTPMPSLPPDKRIMSFDEVALGFDEAMARREAERCLWCDSPITYDPEKCVGCMRCALTCSIRFSEGANPRYAKLIVIPPDRSPSIGEPELVFKEDCDACGSCVRACTYGALTRKAAEQEIE